MLEEYGKETEFWEDTYPSDVNETRMSFRPALIIKFHLKRYRKQHGCTQDGSIKEFSRKSGISESDVKKILGGELPTMSQIHKIISTFGWSLFFIFGISESCYKQMEKIFFNELDIRHPSIEDRESFKHLYKECLRQKYEDEKGVRS